jgi:hypothetical protein
MTAALRLARPLAVFKATATFRHHTTKGSA